mgnify:CR=1 FL=1
MIDIEEEEEKETDEIISFGETLFLSMKAFITELRMASLTQENIDKKLLSSSSCNNFMEALLVIFVSDKTESEKFNYKLQKLLSALYDSYIV